MDESESDKLGDNRLRIVTPKLPSDEHFPPPGTYYTGAEASLILGTLPNPERFSQMGAWRQLERVAHSYCCVHWHERTEPTPTKRLRTYVSIKNKLVSALRQLEEISDTDEFEIAANNLAKEDGSLPDFGLEYWGESIPLESYWPAHKQIKKSVEGIAWLDRVLQASINMATARKAQGKKIDTAKYYLCMNLWQLTNVQWRQPSLTAWTDRNTDLTVGALADFLERVARPLGIGDSRAALVKTYKRGVEHWKEAWRANGHIVD